MIKQAKPGQRVDNESLFAGEVDGKRLYLLSVQSPFNMIAAAHTWREPTLMEAQVLAQNGLAEQGSEAKVRLFSF